MSLIPRNLPLPIHTLPVHNPGYPNTYTCDTSYGRNILPLDCLTAVDTDWPKGRTPLHYYFRDPSPSSSFHLPISDHYGSCTVSIESSAPPISPPNLNSLDTNYFSLMPDELRGVAGYIIQKCAAEMGGVGGFVTLHVDAAENWVASLANSANEHNLDNGTMGRQNDGAFLTITITNPDAFELRPGDTDPNMAALMSNYAFNLSATFPQNEQPFKKIFFQEMASFLRSKTEIMSRGRSDGEPWWTHLEDDGGSWDTVTRPDGGSDLESTASSPEQDEDEGGDETDGNSNMTFDDSDMTYQCDTGLGAPDVVDCEKLSWSGLKSPDTVETLQPNVPNIYSQGTCALGISSPTAITITWAHLLAAFATLNTLCVQNPIASVHGGRAYFGKQSMSSWVVGKRDSVGGVNGGEALPVGVNATVWRHDSDSGSALNCEWQKAMGREDVSGCEVA